MFLFPSIATLNNPLRFKLNIMEIAKCGSYLLPFSIQKTNSKYLFKKNSQRTNNVYNMIFAQDEDLWGKKKTKNSDSWVVSIKLSI